MATSAKGPSKDRRRVRELRTLSAMTRLYCRRHHGGGPPCDECRALLDYAAARLDRCVFGADKPTCAHCPIHCYKPDRREQVRRIMRYAGPRMLLRHPILTLMHLLVDGRRVVPTRRSPHSPRSGDDVGDGTSATTLVVHSPRLAE